MYVVNLFRDGFFFGQRTMTCGPKTFKDACAQWTRNGYTYQIVSQPKSK